MVAEHARLEDRGVDAVMLAQRRDEVAALNELARARAVEAERVHGPGLTVDGKEYQAGDRVLCLTNDRGNGVSNGTRATVIAVDVERQTLTLERADHRQVVIDTTRYDAIDRGYAMTVHKAQGMTAEVALVVGSDGATREWTYTAMSRGTEATHYYAVAQPPERDRLGVSHAPTQLQPADERIVRSWERSLQKELALDYPDWYRDGEREHTPSRCSTSTRPRRKPSAPPLPTSALPNLARRNPARGSAGDRSLVRADPGHGARPLAARG